MAPGYVVGRGGWTGWGVFLSAYGEIWCPLVGNFMSASGEFLLSVLTALGGVAQRSELVIAESKRTHAGRERHGHGGAGAAGGPSAVPGVECLSVELASQCRATAMFGMLVLPIAIGTRSLHALDNRDVGLGKRLGKRLDPQCGRRARHIDVALDHEGDAVEAWQPSSRGDGAVGCLCRLERLLSKHDRHGVDDRVNGFNPSQVRLDHLLARDLPCPYRLGHAQGAHGQSSVATVTLMYPLTSPSVEP